MIYKAPRTLNKAAYLQIFKISLTLRCVPFRVALPLTSLAVYVLRFDMCQGTPSPPQQGSQAFS